MLAACGAEGGPLDPVEQAELAAAERRWAARSFRDYSFELRRFCSCPADWRVWSVVQVRGDTVTDVRLIDAASSLPFHQLGEWPTIDSLFARIRELARHEVIVALSVSFDSQLGFPTVIDFDGNLPDVSGRYEARNVLPLGSLSVPSNQRMQLTERALPAACLADGGVRPILAAKTLFRRAPGELRLARSAIDARVR